VTSPRTGKAVTAAPEDSKKEFFEHLPEIASLIHSDRKIEAAKQVLKLLLPGESSDSVANEEQANKILTATVQQCLAAKRLLEAAQLLWPLAVFNPHPESVKQVWELFDRARPTGLVMGAGSMSKTYTLGVRCLLEWIRDPEWTSVRVVGPSESHLVANLFSHLVSLHSRASIPLPGRAMNLFIGLDPKDQLSSVAGVVIPVGAARRAGRLQGVKRRPRPAPHPEFGALSRLLVLIDEAEVVHPGIWSDVENLLTGIQANDNGMKILAAFNPADITSDVARLAEPPKGWASFKVEEDYRWKSSRGWEVLRLDAKKCENVVQGKVLYPGLQTSEGLKQLEISSGGPQSPGYMTFGRGAYPTKGSGSVIVSVTAWQRAQGIPVWTASRQEWFVGIDPALEGVATISVAFLRWGMATGIYRTASEVGGQPSVTFPGPRWVLYLERLETVQPGDTVEVARSLQTLLVESAVSPENVAIDCTGHGAGVADLLKHDYGPVISVNYSQAPTDLPITLEDMAPPRNMFKRIDTELWFALRGWLEHGGLFYHPDFAKKLSREVLGRRYKMSLGKPVVEPKRDFMARGNLSPDSADSLALALHAARMVLRVSPSMRSGMVVTDPSVKASDGYFWGGPSASARVDSSCGYDILEPELYHEEI
jgi:hypothetical protein